MLAPLYAPGCPLPSSVITLPLTHPPAEFGCRIGGRVRKIFQHQSES